MTDFTYTPAQARAVNLRDKNIIISAAAGSGKTKVLVDRVISMVTEEKIDIDRMIIVTFTNKASIEMKDRIRKGLEEKIKEDPQDGHFLKKQIKSLKTAHIQTLHAFCADMLRENFYFLENLSPSFKVANENQTAILKRDAVNQVFDENYENMNENFESFLHNFSSTRDDKTARDVILLTYDYIHSQVDPFGFLEQKSREVADISLYLQGIEQKLEKILQKIQLNINFSKEKSMREKYKACFEEDYRLVGEGLYILSSKDDFALDDFIKYSNFKFPNIPRKTKEDDPDENEYVKKIRDSYKKDFQDLAKSLSSMDSKTLARFSPIEKKVLSEINRLTKEFAQVYAGKKLEKNYLDFTDMEHKFIELLENERAVDKLKKQFSYIFFDEYQDSNEIQNYIIEKLKAEDNLFFVGDVKQSIYAFRLAEPGLFLEKLESYKEDPKSERIDLNQNFRTDQDLVLFNNFIFDNLMTKESSKIDYKNGGHRLYSEKVFDDIKNPKIQLDLLDKDLDQEAHLADLIEDIVADGFEYRDIAILFRAGSRVYKYEDELKRRNIPYYSDISKLSFEDVEVNFFINILKYIVNPKDDISLLSVIRSKIFDFDEDEIAKIRLSFDSKYFYEAFDNYKEDDEIYEKIINLKTVFYDFSYNLSLMSLFEFGNYIFEKTSYYDFLLARDRGEERVKNVESFIDLMADYDENNDNGLYGFLSYVDSLKSDQADNFQAARDLSENENLVRLMTIHKSKGLEFKVVILPELDKTFNKQTSRAPIVFDKDLGIGINVADYENKIRISSIKRDLILEKIQINEKQEEMRILYVALTRAINKIYMIGRGSLDQKEIKKYKNIDDFLSQNSYQDRILSILFKDKIMAEYNDGDYQTDLFEGGFLAVNEVLENKSPSRSELINLYDFINSKDFDSKLVAEYEKIYKSPYKYLDQTKSSLKKSVTEISKNFSRQEEGYEKSDFNQELGSIEYRKPDFMVEKKEFRPVDRGSIIHKVFQNLEIKKYDLESLDLALKDLVSQRKLKKEELAVLDRGKFIDFFNSDLVQDLKEKSINIRREESFLMKYQDIYVNGQIDLMFEMKDGLVIFDFKTDKRKRPGFYDRQLLLYKKAVEEALGKKVTAAYIYRYSFGEFSLLI